MSQMTTCSIEPKEQSRFVRPCNLSCVHNVPLDVTRQLYFSDWTGCERILGK